MVMKQCSLSTVNFKINISCLRSESENPPWRVEAQNVARHQMYPNVGSLAIFENSQAPFNSSTCNSPTTV